MLTSYLVDHTDFFTNFPKELFDVMDKQSDWEIVISALIMRHIGQLVCNGHAITVLYANPTELTLNTLCSKTTPAFGKLFYFFKSVRMFTAIYPKISILNHSCGPNISNRLESFLVNNEILIFKKKF